MNNMKFSKKEKKELAKTLDVILDDLEELWNVSQLEELETYFFDRDFSFAILINKEGIFLEGYPYSMTLEKFKPRRKRPVIENYNLVFMFLKNYEYIRERLEGKVKSTAEEKNLGIEEIINLRNKYNKEATIEIDMPATNNQYEIQVTEKNGQTIGEVKLGYGTFRIITNGCIVLNESKDKKEKPKVKELKQ